MVTNAVAPTIATHAPVLSVTHSWRSLVSHHAADNTSKAPEAGHQDNGSNNGFSVVAHALAKLGIKHMYGVVGIPVTELASAAQVHHPLLTCLPRL